MDLTLNFAESLMRMAAVCSFVLYVLVALTLCRGSRARRLVWTAACLLYLVHVFCAFHFIHYWSHAAALAATARQTNEVVGLDWGGGLYVNYVFTAIWCADVLWWWALARSYDTRPRYVEWSVQIFLAFMWFNATVVFGTPLVRVLGVAVWLIVLAFWVRRSVEKTSIPRKKT